MIYVRSEGAMWLVARTVGVIVPGLPSHVDPTLSSLSLLLPTFMEALSGFLPTSFSPVRTDLGSL